MIKSHIFFPCAADNGFIESFVVRLLIVFSCILSSLTVIPVFADLILRVMSADNAPPPVRPVPAFILRVLGTLLFKAV